MEVRLVSVEIEGFKSFLKRVLFTFPVGNAVVAICGKWKDSTVSSGSGKTSMIEAIAWVFGISDASVDSVKHWFAPGKKPYVKVTLQAGPDTIEAIRDPKLSLVINGEPYNSLVKGAKEKLQEILGKNPEMVKAITYRKQRVRGKIVNSTDSELKEFLTQPLGLDEVETAAETFMQSTNRIQSSIDLMKRDVQNFEMTLPMNFVSDADLQAAGDAFEAAKVRYDSLQHTQKEYSELWHAAEEVKAEINKIHQLNAALQGKRRDNASYKTSILNLQREIAELEKNACPTCKRDWDASQNLKEAKMAEMDRFISAFEVNLEYIKNGEPVLTSLPNLEAKLQTINGQIGQLTGPVDVAAQSMKNAQNNLNSLLGKRKNYESLSQKLENSKAAVAAQERELAIAQGAAKLLGRSGFLGSVFDEILADIEVRTNDMLAHFPNASQLTVQISSTKVVKTKGTSKKEISIGITRNGIDLSLDDISGGQQSAIELCSDLAAAEAIRARSGGALKWICLDEVMDGLGATEKKEVVAMIKDRVKGLVLMIEHATEIKESFDQVIEIEYDGRESYVANV
jgi:DNA repair exonuclease SbcCD ATPase subunit